MKTWFISSGISRTTLLHFLISILWQGTHRSFISLVSTECALCTISLARCRFQHSSVWKRFEISHYNDIIMSATASQITSLAIVYSSVYSGADLRKHRSSAYVTALCEGNLPVTGEFPAQRASNAENVSIWWHHHVLICAIDDDKSNEIFLPGTMTHAKHSDSYAVLIFSYAGNTLA